jgi:transmembrane sensor
MPNVIDVWGHLLRQVRGRPAKELIKTAGGVRREASNAANPSPKRLKQASVGALRAEPAGAASLGLLIDQILNTPSDRRIGVPGLVHGRRTGGPVVREAMHNINRHLRWCLSGLLAWQAIAVEPSPHTAWKTYETSVGANVSVALRDGNNAQLNTNTRLRTLIDGTSHLVTLDRGEVFFQVGGSPLQVIVHGVTISGAETSFSVRDYGDGDVDIVSLEGVVHINLLQAEHVAAISEAQSVDRIVSAGQWAAVRDRHLILNNVGRSTIRRKLMWRYGMVEFADIKVEEAAAEFNRYNETKLVVEDHAQGCRRIGGRFSVTDIDGFVKTLSRIFEMRIQRSQTSSGTVIHVELM